MLTDMLMPGMTGLKLAERLAPLHPEMKVLYMSGHGDIPTPDSSTLDPKIDFLPKPFFARFPRLQGQGVAGCISTVEKVFLGNPPLPR